MFTCDLECIVEGFEQALPEHKLDLRIIHNNHNSYAQSLREYIFEDDQFDDAALNTLCLNCGDIWEIIWYPKNSRDRHHVYANTLKDAIERVGVKV